MEEAFNKNHSIITENRKKITLTGIKQVISFDDETIMLDISCGKLAIKGIGLHIINFDAESGDLSGEGKISALIYTAEENSGGFLSRIFR